MNRYARRLIVALVMSSACFAATAIWYHTGLDDRGRGGDKTPVALLQDHVNDVQRKPLARVIWESISKNENLYAGEAIRTNSTSEAKILFLRTQTLIELEPNSLVVLEENANGIALEFLKGNLFVKGGKGEGAAGALTLKTGKGQIDLSKAEVALSKTQKGDVDLEVFKGTAELTQDGKTVTLDKDKSGIVSESGLLESAHRIRVLSPLPGDPVYVDPRTDRTVSIEWEKLPPGYRVFVERGRTRERLTRYEGASAPGEAGRLQVPQGVGKFVFRLVAVPEQADSPELTSKIFSADVIAKAPPVLLEPENEALVVLNGENPTLRVKWATRTHLESLAVEIAKDPGLKDKVVQEYLDSQMTFAELKLKEPGTYHWRITGFMKVKGKMEPVSSDIQKFTLKIGIDLIPPKLRSPLMDQKLAFEQVQASGLYLSWDPVPGIREYRVEIKPTGGGEPLRRTVNASPLRLTELTSGSHAWTVVSLDASGTASPPSETRTFVIEEMPHVEWVNGPDPEEYLYITDKPTVFVAWKRGPDSIASWRYRIAPAGTLQADAPWNPADKPSLRANVGAQGDYEVEVEALNAAGKPVARSTAKLIAVKEKPFLPPPQFAADMPSLLQSNRNGTLDLVWEPVDGARKYKVEIADKDGKLLTEQIVERNQASLKRLKPGDYVVTLKSIDEHERSGKSGPVRPLYVPPVSNIRAPAVRKIEVK